ncbi:MAG: PKD domain-containing protein, partial [Halobacteriales archaeon]|nr:PKD domain-containing protein [Halobacteriales archaeon]
VNGQPCQYNTFSIVVYEATGNIDVVLMKTDRSMFDDFVASIGIQNTAGTRGLNYTFGNESVAPKDVRFYVNHVPTPVPNAITIDEDSGSLVTPLTFAPATDLDGDPTLSCIVTSVPAGTFTVTGCNVAYTPAVDYCTTWPGGSPLAMTWHVQDDLGAPGGAAGSLLINVTCINDPPVFSDLGNLAAMGGSPVAVPSWAYGIAAGPATAADEATQTISFTLVSIGNPTLFAPGGAPIIDSAGQLLFTAEPVTVPASTTACFIAADNGPAPHLPPAPNSIEHCLEITITPNAQVPPPPPQDCIPGVPANDCYVDARVIPTTPYTLYQSTFGATYQDGEPQPCGGIGSTVWFRWTAPSDGTATVTTSGPGTDFDTVLAAYTGYWISDLADIACNDDAGTGASSVTFQCVAGTLYYIQAGGFGGDAGELQLSIEGCQPSMPLPPPPVTPRQAELQPATAPRVATQGTNNGGNGNIPPVAAFTALLPQRCDAWTASFDATSSYDPDGLVQGWSWDFGDGSGASGPTATHTYGREGSFQVELTIQDDRGAAKASTHQIEVRNCPPLSVLAPEATARVGQDLSVCLRPSGGRGGPYTFQTTDTTPLPPGARLEGGCILWMPGPSQAGTYCIKLSVSDGANSLPTCLKVTVFVPPAVASRPTDETPVPPKLQSNGDVTASPKYGAMAEPSASGSLNPWIGIAALLGALGIGAVAMVRRNRKA